MKSFIVGIMAAALIMAGSMATAADPGNGNGNGENGGCESYYEADGTQVQGGVTGFAVEDIGFDNDYVTLGSASVDIVAGEGMLIEADGESGCAYTVDYTQDQSIEATYTDSSVVGSETASVSIEGFDEYGGHVEMYGAMGHVGITKVAVNDLEVGHWENEEEGTEGSLATLGAGSIDAIGIQAMYTESDASGMGMEGNMDLAQDLTVTTPDSTIIMLQGSSYHSSSVVPEEIVVPQ